MNPDVGREMRGGEHREPAGDVLFAERKGFASEKNEGIKDRAPCDLFVVEGIVEMARADGVFGEDQRARVRIPDRQRPVANQHGEALLPPIFISGGGDLEVGGTRDHKIAQLAYEFGAIVQAAVPGEDGAGRANVWLRFAARLLGSVESAIEDAEVCRRVGAFVVGAIWGENRLDLGEVRLIDWLAVHIPSSKLNAHGLLPEFALR